MRGRDLVSIHRAIWRGGNLENVHCTVCREGWGFSNCPLYFAGRGGDLVNVHYAVWRDGDLVNV